MFIINFFFKTSNNYVLPPPISWLYLFIGIQVPISKLIQYLTFNIIVRMIAGKRFDWETVSREEESKAWRLMRVVHHATYLGGVFVEVDAFPDLSGLDIQGYVKFMKRTAKEKDAVLS